MKDRKCPKCGGKLFARAILTDEGITSKEVCELYDIYGHTFSVPIKDLMEENHENRN